MQIRPVDLYDRSQVRRFVDFPYSLYRDCSLWTPPIYSSALEALNPRKHPFYQHSQVAFFLAAENGQALGRLAVMNNRRFNEYRGSNCAFFGLFEAIDETAVSQALFEAGFEWACRCGLDRILGPRGMIGSDTGGVLVEGFDHPPALAVPYNLPYYDRLIHTAGFEKDTDFLSGYFSTAEDLPERFYQIAERVKQRRGFRIKTFASKREMQDWIPRIKQVHAQAFAGTHTYYPPSEAEWRSITQTLLSIADTRLVRLVMKEEQIIGFIFAYHDLSEGLKKTGGRLFPFGWIRLLQEKQRTKVVDVNGIGMLPLYQGLGGNILLYVELTQAVKALGFEWVEVVQVNENNFKSFSDMEHIGAHWHKRHRCYQRAL